MPDQTIDASRDHAVAARTIDTGVEEARQLLDDVRAAGVDFDDIVGRILVEEGVASFADSFDSLIDSIEAKRVAMRGAA